MDLETALHALESEDARDRIDGAAALIDIRDTAALHPLMHATKDEDYRVRAWAASALGWLADAAAIEALIPLLYESPHADWDVQINPPTCACFALALIGDYAAVLPLLEDDDEHVRSLAVVTLRYIGDLNAMPALQYTAENDPVAWVRAEAASTIDAMHTDDFLPLRETL